MRSSASLNFLYRDGLAIEERFDEDGVLPRFTPLNGVGQERPFQLSVVRTSLDIHKCNISITFTQIRNNFRSGDFPSVAVVLTAVVLRCFPIAPIRCGAVAQLA